MNAPSGGAAEDPASVLALHTEDAVLEVRSLGLRFDSHAAIEADYRRMQGSMAEVEITPLDRFATEERVVDECLVRFRVTGDGLTNAPCCPGDRVELRFLQVFHMRGGRIARETVFKGWRRARAGATRPPPAPRGSPPPPRRSGRGR